MVAGAEGIGGVHARIADIQARIQGVAASPAGGIAGAAAAGVSSPAAGSSAVFSGVLTSAQAMALEGGPAPASIPVNGDMRSAAARRQFAVDLLARLGMPQTSENVRAVVAWQEAEGTRAAFNPLATTQRSESATDFNSVGVKNYTSYAQGLAATVTTLHNGRYDDILAALRDGTSAARVGAAVASSPWGTGDGVTRVLSSGRV